MVRLVDCSGVGLARAADSPLRFYVRGNPFVSGPQALNGEKSISMATSDRLRYARILSTTDPARSPPSDLAR
jgi:hypothetical protein